MALFMAFFAFSLCALASLRAYEIRYQPQSAASLFGQEFCEW